MNSALKSLKDSNPEIFEEFMSALREDLGVGGDVVSSFTCPNCQTSLQITLATTGAGAGKSLQAQRRRPGRPAGKKAAKKPMGGTLNPLLIELARLRKATTGKLNAEFKSVMRDKIKKMSAQEVRAHKIEWVKHEIDKAKAKNRAA